MKNNILILLCLSNNNIILKRRKILFFNIIPETKFVILYKTNIIFQGRTEKGISTKRKIENFYQVKKKKSQISIYCIRRNS